MMKLRDYQTRSIDQLYSWFEKNQKGNPVLNMPGGSGKSVVIASLAKDSIQNWPDTRVLMLVRSKELVSQNSAKLRQLWPNAPMGVVSASLNKKQFGEQITYASIDSVVNHADRIGHIDLCLIDEAHMVSPSDEGNYRKIIVKLLAINPFMRVIGFSASPYRLGHGMINEGENAIFKDIIEPVSIEELVYLGHLVPLRSKVTSHKLDATGIKKRGGDYIQSEMERTYNTDDHNKELAAEVAVRAKDRRHWLIFASGREHARNLSQSFKNLGITSDWLATPISKTEREKKLFDFESGKVRVLINVGILTTGYDFPALDCIVFARSTMSPGLYLQMAVRGMRPAPEKTDCLVLDFAGVVATHGPITAVQPPKTGKKSDEPGEAPVKACPDCFELVHPSAKECPSCGYQFPIAQKKLQLHHDDIMGLDGSKMEVTDWRWRKHLSRTSGKEMLAVSYYGGLSDPAIVEYFPMTHEGYAGEKARRNVYQIMIQAAKEEKYMLSNPDDLDDILEIMHEGTSPPKTIEYKKDGKFFRVMKRSWA